jgi:hypothetical protein
VVKDRQRLKEPNGAKIKSDYSVGLVLPENCDSSLRSGTTPSLSLFLNGTTVNVQTQALLQIDIINHVRAIANPQPPVSIDAIVINPPATENTGAILKQVYSPLALLTSLTVGSTFIPPAVARRKIEENTADVPGHASFFGRYPSW